MMNHKMQGQMRVMVLNIYNLDVPTDDEESSNSSVASEEPFTLGELLEDTNSRIPREKIPKPEGSGGREFNVRQGIGEDMEWYIDILCSIHHWCDKYLDTCYSLKKQDRHALIFVEKYVLIDHPELQHLQGCWLIHALIQQYLKNSSEQARESNHCRAKRRGQEPTLATQSSKQKSIKSKNIGQKHPPQPNAEASSSKNVSNTSSYSAFKLGYVNSDSLEQSDVEDDPPIAQRNDKGKGKAVPKATQKRKCSDQDEDSPPVNNSHFLTIQFKHEASLPDLARSALDDLSALVPDKLSSPDH
ncbi:hypothetical protein K439DRAFT_1531794 [Ramaria rubella]|nr:hypothetical protein K439DRAFT_1531794 [Ramaria rubella]